MKGKIMDSKYRIDFDIMRILLTILVVIGHASYYSHSTIWGGVILIIFIWQISHKIRKFI